jgi:hypothetical protein
MRRQGRPDGMTFVTSALGLRVGRLHVLARRTTPIRRGVPSGRECTPSHGASSCPRGDHGVAVTPPIGWCARSLDSGQSLPGRCGGIRITWGSTPPTPPSRSFASSSQLRRPRVVFVAPRLAPRLVQSGCAGGMPASPTRDSPSRPPEQPATRCPKRSRPLADRRSSSGHGHEGTHRSERGTSAR